MKLHLDRVAAYDKSPSKLKLASLFISGCGDRSSVYFEDLVKMGNKILTGDFTFNYEYSDFNGKLDIKMSANLDKFISFENQVTFHNMNPNNINAPYLGHAQWSFYNMDLFNSRDIFCAAENNQNVEEFKQHHIQSLTHFLQEEGVVLSDNFIKRYIKFNDDMENMAITLAPKIGVELEKLDSITYAEALEIYNFALNLNGRAVDPIVTRVEVQPKKEKANAQEEKSQEVKYTTIRIPSLKQLSRAVEEKVILTTTDGKDYDGVISDVNNKSIQIKVKSHGGYVTYNLKPEEIKIMQIKPR